MLDKKTVAVLKTLNKIAEGSAYKVITSEEILMCLPQKSQYDIDGIKQIISFLEKQEYLNIKFSEENTYCYSLLPKARIFLEQDQNKTKTKKAKTPVTFYLIVMLAAFVGTMLALLIFFYLTF